MGYPIYHIIRRTLTNVIDFQTLVPMFENHAASQLILSISSVQSKEKGHRGFKFDYLICFLFAGHIT